MDKENNNGPVDFSRFMEELEKKRRFHTGKGADFSAETADLSIKAAQHAGDVVPFYDRKQAKQVVLDSFPELPEDKADDVGSMLHLVVKDLTGESRETEEEPDKY